MLILFKVLMFVILAVVQPSDVTDEKRLIDHLLNNYSIHIRPVRNNSNPIVVTFGFNLIQIISIVERDQSITTKLWMRMRWKNELMTWDPPRWGNITQTRLNRESLWTPDIFLQEDIGEDISSGPDKYKTPIVMSADGTQLWLVPVKLQSTCMIDVKDFPFDRQSCQFIFISWTHDQTQLDLKAETKPVVTENYINSSEWKLVDVDVQVVSVKYACCANPFVDIRYTLHLRRKPLYYIYNVVLPCVIQMVIILFTFFLPPDSGERIGVVITVLLVFAVYLEVLSSNLPRGSNSTPILSHFYITAMIESACSLIITCFVLAVHFKGTEKGIGPMPHFLRKYFLTHIAKFVGVTQNIREYTDDDLLALKLKENSGLDNDDDSYVAHNNGQINNEKRSENGIKKSEPYFGTGMDTLVGEVRVITSLIHDMNRQDEIEEEWQMLAKVLDRICFFAFFMVFLVSSLVILVPACTFDYN